MPLPPPIDLTVLEPSIGKTLAEFTEHAATIGAVVRVVAVDGEAQVMTLDWSPVRVNVGVAGDDQVVVTIDGIG